MLLTLFLKWNKKIVISLGILLLYYNMEKIKNKKKTGKINIALKFAWKSSFFSHLFHRHLIVCVCLKFLTCFMTNTDNLIFFLFFGRVSVTSCIYVCCKI